MSRTLSLTRSQARSLLSSPRSNMANSLTRCSTCNRTRMAQISFSLNGAFWPTSLPLFHGSWWDLLDDSSMMNSLQLKGIQLSCVLTAMASLIVSFGVGSFELSNHRHKWQTATRASRMSDSLRHIGVVHDSRLTGCPIHCPSQAVRGGLQSAPRSRWEK